MIFDIFMYPLGRRRERRTRDQIKFSPLRLFHVYLLTLFVLLFSLCTYHYYFDYTNTISHSVPLPPSLSLITAHLGSSLNRSSDIYACAHDIIVGRFLFSSILTVLVNELPAINIGSMNVSYSSRRKCLL